MERSKRIRRRPRWHEAEPTGLRSWYLAQAEDQLRPRIAAFVADMGVSYSRIWVRDLKYRWGSCTPGGTLSFNWRIIQAVCRGDRLIFQSRRQWDNSLTSSATRVSVVDNSIPSNARPVNLSARSYVGTGSAVQIAGFVICKRPAEDLAWQS